MSYFPSLSVATCPACHSICGKPKLKSKGIFRRFVRLECACGVCGSWQLEEGKVNPWNLAGRGWALIAGSGGPRSPKPPKPK